MEDAIVASVFLLLVVIAFNIFKPPIYHELPALGFREYLPGGRAYALVCDSRKLVVSLLSLAQEYGNIYRMWLGPQRVVVTSYPADIAQVLMSDDFLKPDAMVAVFDCYAPGSFLTMEKNQHRAARKSFRQKFNHSLLVNFRPEMTHAIHELCQNLYHAMGDVPEDHFSDTINITNKLAATTIRVMTNVAFGFPLSQQERQHFAELADETTLEMMREFMGYPIRQALSVFGVRDRVMHTKALLRKYCERFVTSRLEQNKNTKESGSRDLMDAIVALDDSDLSTLVSDTAVFAIAGTHSTSIAVAWTIFEVCQDRHIQQRIHRELDEHLKSRPLDQPITEADVECLEYMRKVWKESLRVRPPGPLFGRVAAKDLVMKGSGTSIPKGGLVMALAIHAQTRNDIWGDGDVFRPERWGTVSNPGDGDRTPPGAYVPFSVGPKNCAGQFLADFEGILILAELFRRFDMQLAVDPKDLHSCTGWVQSPKFSSVKGGDLDLGLPVRLRRRVVS